MKAVAFRFPEDLVERMKIAAGLANTSVTAYVKAAIEAKLVAPSILDQPMFEVPRGPDLTVCAHPWRDKAGVCRVCGDR